MDIAVSDNTRKQDLIQEITLAFDGVARGNGVTLHEATVIDSYGTPAERAKARATDTEKRWQDVPARDIREIDAALSFLDAEGLNYYIPAYLIWYLQNIDNTAAHRSNTFESIPFHLTYQMEGSRLDRFERFTREQGRAIAHFLIFVAERREASEMQDFLAEAEYSGMTPEEVDPYVRDYYFERSAVMRKALAQYWGQFL